MKEKMGMGNPEMPEEKGGPKTPVPVQNPEEISNHSAKEKIGRERMLHYLKEDIQKQLTMLKQEGDRNEKGGIEISEIKEFPIKLGRLKIDDMESLLNHCAWEHNLDDEEEDDRGYLKIKIHTSEGIFNLPVSEGTEPAVALADENIDCKYGMAGLDDYLDILESKGIKIDGFGIEYFDQISNTDSKFFIEYKK